MITFKKFRKKKTSEEVGAVGAPTNSVGSGNIAGVGVGPQGEPGRPGKLVRRKRRINEDETTFAGNKVFDVDAEEFHKSKFGKNRYHKWNKYVRDESIREYGIKNRKKPIIVKDPRTGSMYYLRNKT